MDTSSRSAKVRIGKVDGSGIYYSSGLLGFFGKFSLKSPPSNILSTERPITIRMIGPPQSA